MRKILPRHLEIVQYVEFFFMEKLKRDFPTDKSLHSRMSIIEVTADSQLLVRMAYICFLASHKVNGVSFEHTSILK